MNLRNNNIWDIVELAYTKYRYFNDISENQIKDIIRDHVKYHIKNYEDNGIDINDIIKMDKDLNIFIWRYPGLLCYRKNYKI